MHFPWHDTANCRVESKGCASLKDIRFSKRFPASGSRSQQARHRQKSHRRRMKQGGGINVVAGGTGLVESLTAAKWTSRAFPHSIIKSRTAASFHVCSILSVSAGVQLPARNDRAGGHDLFRAINRIRPGLREPQNRNKNRRQCERGLEKIDASRGGENSDSLKAGFVRTLHRLASEARTGDRKRFGAKPGRRDRS